MDNPNVWYEVGYAIASNIEIILICSSERTTQFPFDIRHRNILKYSTEAPSDYDKLKENIIKRARAILDNPLIKAPKFNVKLNVGGLSYHEITLLGSILSNQDTPMDSVSAWGIKQEMRNNGFNEIAFNLAVRKLLNRGFLEVREETGYNGEPYSAYVITEEGNRWIIENEEKFSYEVIKEVSYASVDGDDIPF